jgi:hypothetical protein
MAFIPEVIALSRQRRGPLGSRLMADRSRCGVEGAFGGDRRSDPNHRR